MICANCNYPIRVGKRIATQTEAGGKIVHRDCWVPPRRYDARSTSDVTVAPPNARNVTPKIER